ncbi:MAG: undecaprenyl-diphosphate phosphatase, partial [Gammaproteobacteria bacterium]|nr:undecaprenyl-diphosphate phosphatase [Gammaproteobacteria bacterium]
LLLLLADQLGRQDRGGNSLGLRDAVLIGLAQVLSLVPGTSRSGITMTAALALGLTRTEAARFSFLLSIPTILMAGSYESWKLLNAAGEVDWGLIALGTGVAAVSAWLCIHFFMKLIERVGMLPFVLYRLLLGVVLIAVFL